MTPLSISIETLEPMTVAAVVARGSSPEVEAWDRLTAYAEPRGLLDDPVAHPWLGFNNPSPTRAGDEYGYELWIRVDTGHDPGTGPDREAGVALKEVPGGTYAVARCRLVGDPHGTVQEVWRLLADQAASAGHRVRSVHELERVVDPTVKMEDLELDLMLPIEDPRGN
jgi:DNA gyrase inhibitor GyrI